MSSGVVAIDARGDVAMLNPGAQSILGCPDGAPSDAYGRPCVEVLRAQPAIARLLLETLGGRPALSRAELVLKGAAGQSEHTIGFTLTPVRDARAEVCGAAIIFRDLTPFERMGEQQRLRERLAALGQMAAGLAHEIRNPLAGMEVVTGLLKRRLANRDEERALVSQLQSEVRALARTVESCLEFVRPSAPERGPVDPRNLLEESLESAFTRLPFSGEIERAFEAELPKLHADADQLRTVLTNLIANALEAMDGDGPEAEKKLVLGLSRVAASAADWPVCLGVDGHAEPRAPAREEVVITVADSGPGVPSELAEKIFYPFFTTKQSGSGVGLATAQKIVAGHGGALELDSEPGMGCAFRVRIPIEDAES